MDDDLEVFVPVPRKLTVKGVKFSITPLPVRKIPAFAKAVRPVAPWIMQGDLTSALFHNQTAMFEAIAVATDVDVGWIGDLHGADFMKLAGAVFEVNADFFVRHVLPLARVANEEILKAVIPALEHLPKPSPGAQPSPGSASGATGSGTSST